jgi:DNA transformation protein and related proteins
VALPARYALGMPVSASYREYVADQLAALPGVVIKRMFGGLGLYFDERMFAVVDDDTMYLRVDDATRPEFVKRDMAPFRPVKRDPKKVSLNYYQLPAEVLEDSDVLVEWAKRAIQAAKSPTAAVVRRAKKKAR